MKTITFSNDQLEAVRDALKVRILDLGLELGRAKPDNGRNMMRIRDLLDVTRQALDAVQS